MQLSAVLGLPDQPHFSHPPPPSHPAPPPPLKKKSPSQLRRQERRQREAEAKAADEAVSSLSNNSKEHESELLSDVSNPKETEIVLESYIENRAEKLPENAADELNLGFKCNQCDYTNPTEKGLGMHIRKKHRISQVDGVDDSYEDTDMVTLELDDLGGIIGPDLPPNTFPPSKVLHPKAGIGHVQQENVRDSYGDTATTFPTIQEESAYMKCLSCKYVHNSLSGAGTHGCAIGWVCSS